MFDKMLDIAAQYGPFPVGIVVGMYIMKWAISMQLKSSEKEKGSLRKEKTELLEFVTAQQARIDKLHEKINTDK